ncbi:MAG TPA: hypothetical protein VEK08_11750 [Planctomycetota bacterium]|nr:hypothetical protein [Planctomycetota bacterium]
MTIRYYIHAWQGLLMFVAGVISVLASFGGYMKSGGGEELLRRALINLQVGKVSFDPINFDWKKGEMTVTNLSHDRTFEWPKENPVARVSGLLAENVTVRMDLLPWPPAVKSITVRGMPKTEIKVTEDFLQSGKVQQFRAEQLPTVYFVDCDLKFTIVKKMEDTDGIGPLHLSGCGGELRQGAAGEPRGAFSLRQLNGRPFNFKLETMEDSRWVFTGDVIQINTTETLKTNQKWPAMDHFDPVVTLVRALFSGEMNAKGTVNSLRVSVQPKTESRKFICDGEVGYSNLELQLPKPEKETGQALPLLLDRLLGADRDTGDKDSSMWPRWMQVDKIKTGERGRVTFHMTDGILNFSCDEGVGSAFTGVRKDQTFPPLESLKGAVETDPEGKTKRIVLRGFLGDELSFETRMDRIEDGSRTYELLLEPRAGDSKKVTFGKPLWRFASRVQDYLNAKKLPEPDEIGHRPLVAFEMETDARHFPWKEMLPPGMRDVSGHMYAKGRFTDGLRLRLDTITLDDHSSFIFGGSESAATGSTSDFGPLWQALEGLFGTTIPWRMGELSLQGKAEVQFGPDGRWETTVLKDFKLSSGVISHAGLVSEAGVAAPVITARHKRLEDQSEILIAVSVPNLWDLKLIGSWKCEPGKACAGEFTLIEKDVPLALHPQREVLPQTYISADKRRVNRTSIVRIANGKVEREFK